MSTGTFTRPAPAPARRAFPRTGGLAWTVLRVHRAALWSWTAFVVFTAGLLLWLLGPGANASQRAFDTYGYYPPGGVDSDKYAYDSLFHAPATLIALATFVVPLFAGSALIGRELESGTARLVWAQSVAPARWLAARLTVPAVLITAGTTLLVVLYRILWAAHSGLLIAGFAPRALYFSIGPATVALPLLGLAVGALTGLLMRRALPALGVAAGIQYLITAFRDRLWPLQRNPVYGALPDLSVHGGALTSGGTLIRDPYCYGDRKCADRHGIVGYTREYLPSPDYWPRQLLETGVLLALTAIVVAVAFAVLNRRVTAA
ncbi:hypothetical protein ACFY93_31620 [Streptomyces sp. NPDC008313]|uniref:hypothetical protein n=1 Tax=Streptomyces sp. NPDC008313 TaxID=3364826 RepID=UPI0036E76B31